ncbi:MAG: hypothetical protein Q9202_004166 [Teloschistes flavicans]
MTDSADASSQVQPNLATYSTGFTIGGQGPIGLTTIFTPPSSCYSTVTYDGTSLWEGGLLQTGDQNCFPPRFTDIFNSGYSPGICPFGWTSVDTAGGPFTQSNGVPGIGIYCCPTVSEYRTMFNRCLTLNFFNKQGFYHRSQDADADDLRNVCASRFSTPLSRVYSVSTRAEGPMPRNADLITVDPASVSANTVFADIIAIVYASTDSAILELMSAATRSSSSVASATPAYRTTAQVSPTRSPTGTPSPSPGELSPGGKAGIVVGAIIGTIVLVLFASFLYRRRQKYQTLAGDTEAKHQGRRREVVPEGAIELPSNNALEMPAYRMKPELGSKNILEMPAYDMRPELGSDNAKTSTERRKRRQRQ